MTTDTTATPGSQTALRRANRQRVLDAIDMAGTPTQAEIARSTGLSAATVSNIVKGLRADGTVDVTPTSSSGRRALAVRLTRPAGVAVGIDFGVDHLRVAIADRGVRVLAEQDLGYDVASDADRGVRRAVWLVETLLTRARIDRSQVIGVGVGVPGPVDAQTGRIDSATILPGWGDYPVGDRLSGRLGVPVHVDNDANLAALGELHSGAGRGCQDLAYVRLASGVGASLVLDGRVYRGAGGTAGELGHMTVDERGPVCRCGNRGCLETLVGEPYLVQMLPPQYHVAGRPPKLADVIERALDGDPGCRRIVSDAGQVVGTGIAVLANLFNPLRVVVGGALTGAGELLFDSMLRAVQQGAVPTAARRLRVVPAELGERGPVLGGLLLATERSII